MSENKRHIPGEPHPLEEEETESQKIEDPAETAWLQELKGETEKQRHEEHERRRQPGREPGSFDSERDDSR